MEENPYKSPKRENRASPSPRKPFAAWNWIILAIMTPVIIIGLLNAISPPAYEIGPLHTAPDPPPVHDAQEQYKPRLVDGDDNKAQTLPAIAGTAPVTLSELSK